MTPMRHATRMSGPSWEVPSCDATNSARVIDPDRQRNSETISTDIMDYGG